MSKSRKTQKKNNARTLRRLEEQKRIKDEEARIAAEQLEEAQKLARHAKRMKHRAHMIKPASPPRRDVPLSREINLSVVRKVMNLHQVTADGNLLVDKSLCRADVLEAEQRSLDKAREEESAAAEAGK